MDAWRALAASVLLTAGMQPAQALVVYDDNFDTAPVVASGVGAVLNASGGALTGTASGYSGTYGNIFRNDTTGLTELSLSNLPAHSGVHISFLLAFLDSWDSTNGSPAPDFISVYVDQMMVGQYTSANASGNVSQYGGGALVFAGVQFDTNFFYTDYVVDYSADPAYTLAHTASTLTIGFQAGGSGWQGYNDEAWGIDNLVVTLAPVPEPAPLALMLAGLAALGHVVRRRR